HAAKSSFRAGTVWRALAFLHQRGWRIMMRYKVKVLAVAQIQISKIGRADAGGVRKHGFENRLQIAGRAGDNSQHFRRRSLLLQRLGKLARTGLELLL